MIRNWVIYLCSWVVDLTIDLRRIWDEKDEENDRENVLICMIERYVLRDFLANMRCRSSIMRYDLTWFWDFETDVFRDVVEEVDEEIEDIIVTDINADFVSVIDWIEVFSTHEMMNRERIDIIDLVDTVSTYVIAKKKEFRSRSWRWDSRDICDREEEEEQCF